MACGAQNLFAIRDCNQKTPFDVRSTMEMTVKIEQAFCLFDWHGNILLDFQTRSSANWPLASPSASDLTPSGTLRVKGSGCRVSRARVQELGFKLWRLGLVCSL